MLPAWTRWFWNNHTGSFIRPHINRTKTGTRIGRIVIAKININRMTRDDLLTLEGMTEDVADAILDWVDVRDDALLEQIPDLETVVPFPLQLVLQVHQLIQVVVFLLQQVVCLHPALLQVVLH